MVSITINILKYDKIVGNKTFNVKKDPDHKSIGFMVGYIQGIEDQDGLSTEFVQ